MEACAEGQVTRVFGSRAEVEVGRAEACASCGTADLCHGLTPRGTLRVEAHNAVGARVGQRVAIASQRSLGVKAAFFVYLVPALLFVIGVFVGSEVLRWPAWGGGLLGLGALALSWFIARAFERSVTKKPEYRLVIARVLPEIPAAGDAGT